ncbi:uncharacterized protein MONOS_2180 [Monocercomonoides exilis]|uniref:uncharacterized protein n=1 Tax=Monocercomonoides exilis TaxID=2049356 RepID=UPI003559FB23|nr:hypothetical protein MONOS_2180 [Monocercomonoides exilis]|eukprot:MONOS_2180.1-p1 / transcript=MONOS_2180.1 / gene=MONOS_2180 / organism=Monocercomonoides_exilis_PA203 / gene_product=unspecified product / transcript_product=unspecified product / location=Mono_scaffold00043:84082-85440(-) / protein_length=384 / sequence_SO=supercontig / SO=protein_coding / is_pseudo=false
MAKRREQKETLFTTRQQMGNFGEIEAPPEPEEQAPMESYRDSRPSPFQRRDSPYERRDAPYERRGGYRGRGGGERSFRERDRMLHEQEGEEGPRFSSGDRGYGGFRRHDRGEQRFDPTLKFDRKDDNEIPEDGPFVVAVSNLPPKTDDIEVGVFLEEKGCEIKDVNPDPEKPEIIIVEFENAESMKTALELSRVTYKGYSIIIESDSKRKEPPKRPAPAPYHDDDERRGGGYRHDRYGDHSRGYDDRRGGYGDRRGGFYDRRGGGGGYGRRGGYGYGDRDRDRDRDDDGYERRRGGGGYGRRGGYGGRGYDREGGYSRDGGYSRGYDGYDDRRDRDEPEAPKEPGAKQSYTLNITPKKPKEDPFGGAKPKDLPPHGSKDEEEN